MNMEHTAPHVVFTVFLECWGAGLESRLFMNAVHQPRQVAKPLILSNEHTNFYSLQELVDLCASRMLCSWQSIATLRCQAPKATRALVASACTETDSSKSSAHFDQYKASYSFYLQSTPQLWIQRLPWGLAWSVPQCKAHTVNRHLTHHCSLHRIIFSSLSRVTITGGTSASFHAHMPSPPQCMHRLAAMSTCRGPQMHSQNYTWKLALDVREA